MVKRADITPDKSLIQKLGLVGYRTEQAIAELLDNSIDARVEDRKEMITVRLSPNDRMIQVADDGHGMNEDDLADAMTVAKGTKLKGQLGQFGMGMNSACSALGKNFVIATSRVDSDEEYQTEYDEEKWLLDESKSWKNLEITARTLGEGEKWHGTKITIKKLKVPVYPNQVSKFKESFGTRYAPYLRSGQISIKINTMFCIPEKPDVVEGSTSEVKISLSKNNKLWGHVALLKKRSVRGDYGIHLFKNKRLIKANEKFGFSAHPKQAQVIGALNMDHVPVNFSKSGFIEDSLEYQEALSAFRESPELKNILRLAQSRREIVASVESVFDYFGGKSPQQYLDRSVNLKIAGDILDKTPRLEVKMDNKLADIRLEALGDLPLYTINSSNSQITVVINKDNRAFKFVKNPLFLIGMIASEIKILATSPNFESVVKERNRSLGKFVEEWSKKPGEASFRDREVEIPYMVNYKLANDLFEPHEYLKEKIGFRFQFTALSTLVPYLHNLRGKVVYTVYTEPGKGEYLADMLGQKFDSKFVVVNKPKSGMLNMLLQIPTVDRIIAIREYSVIRGSTVAAPEKAYLDLVNEAGRGIPIDETELRKVFSSMRRYNLIDHTKLRTYANFIKRMGALERILGDRLQW